MLAVRRSPFAVARQRSLCGAIRRALGREHVFYSLIYVHSMADHAAGIRVLQHVDVGEEPRARGNLPEREEISSLEQLIPLTK